MRHWLGLQGHRFLGTADPLRVPQCFGLGHTAFSPQGGEPVPASVRCLSCKRLTTTPTKGRCPTCYRGYKGAMYGPKYRREARALKAKATTCWLCGKPLPPGVGTADHVRPGDPTSPLEPACASCNYSRGNRPARNL